MDENGYEGLYLSNQLCFPLYAAAREVTKQYRPYLDELGMTYTQYIVMMVLWEYRKCSVKQLGSKLHLDSGTLTPVLKSMEQKGFLQRCRSKEDERVLLVEITEKGKKLRNEAVDIPARVGACVKLTREEAITLHTLLYKVLGGIDENREK